METSLMVNDYPTPPENDQYVDIEINVGYIIKESPFPKDWDREQIIECIKDNLDDYMRIEDMKVLEIDV